MVSAAAKHDSEGRRSSSDGAVPRRGPLVVHSGSTEPSEDAPLAIDLGGSPSLREAAPTEDVDEGGGGGSAISLLEELVRYLTGSVSEDWPRALQLLVRSLGARSALLGVEGPDELPLALAAYGPVDTVTRNDRIVEQIRRARASGEGRQIHSFSIAGEPRIDFGLVSTEESELMGLAVWGAKCAPEVVCPLLRTVACLAQRLLHPLGGEGVIPSAVQGEHEIVFPPGYVVGTSDAITALHRELAAVSRSELPVLLSGETGTGKELLAKTIHLSSERREGPFVAINCAAIPDTLLEAELFGVERRVATGVDPREGRFQQADGGTLFLDEIGEMAPALQVKLLRVLQEREVHPLGGSPRPIEVRVLAATNADLRRGMESGAVRRDLYYRLAGVEVPVPALRDRQEDIPILIRSFLERSLAEAGKQIRGVSVRAMELLIKYQWPGNVRELEHEIRRLVFVCPAGAVLDSGHLPAAFLQQSPESPGRVVERLGADGFDLQDYLDGIERGILTEALARTGGNQTQAADLLSLSRNGLAKKVKRFGIDPSGVVKG